jgi:hypothetical protein
MQLRYVTLYVVYFACVTQVSPPLRMPDYRINDTGHRPQQHTTALSSSKSSDSVASNNHNRNSDEKSAKLQGSTAADVLLDIERVRLLRQQQQQAAAAAADATVAQHDQEAKHGQQAKHVSATTTVYIYYVNTCVYSCKTLS